MSKIVEAVNSMVLNNNKISNVREYNAVFYFSFMNYVWSIWKDEAKLASYTLVFYPGYNNSEDVYDMATAGGYPSKYVSYVSSDEKTKEATESFAELYRVVNEKLYNLENVLDDIISLIDDSDGIRSKK